MYQELKKKISIVLAVLLVVSASAGTFSAQPDTALLQYGTHAAGTAEESGTQLSVSTPSGAKNAAAGTAQTTAAAGITGTTTATETNADGPVENNLGTTPSDASVSDAVKEKIPSEVEIVINADRTVTLTDSSPDGAEVWYLFSEYQKELSEAEILKAENKKQCLNLTNGTETVKPADSGYAYKSYRIYAWAEQDGTLSGGFASKDCMAVISVSVEEAEALTGISAADEGISYKKGEVIVAFKKGITKTDAELSAHLSAAVSTTDITGDTLLSSEIKGETLVDDTGNEPMAVLQVAEGKKVVQAVAELRQNPDVEIAQPNYLYTISDSEIVSEETGGEDSGAWSGLKTQATTVNDPITATKSDYYQWQLGDYEPGQTDPYHLGVDCFGAWDYAKCDGSNSTKPIGVAVLDTGCRTTHEDLRDNIEGAYNAYNAEHGSGNTSDVTDTFGHGTHVCGIIGARSNNGKGGSGVSYNAKIIPVKVSDAQNGIADSTAVMAYKYVIANAAAYNIRVINNSWGMPEATDYVDTGTEWKSELLIQLIDEANAKGILTVCAGGNQYKTMPYVNYPSDYPTCVSVINLERGQDSNNLYRAQRCTSYGGSNYNLPDHQVKNISAPGTVIWSTYKDADNSYAGMVGTSMASPVVAGVAALVFAADSSLTPDECKDILYSTANDLVYSNGSETAGPGWDVYTGYGEVDALRAVQKAIGNKETITVSFRTNGGSFVPSQLLSEAGKVTKPADPARNGYTFAGWYGDAALTQPWDFTGNTVTSSITLYAKWALVDYAITYDLAGGSLAAGVTNPSSYNIETTVFTLNNPVKSGYTFTGWSGTALTGTENTLVTVLKGSTGTRAYTANWTSYTSGGTSSGGGGGGGASRGAATAGPGTSAGTDYTDPAKGAMNTVKGIVTGSGDGYSSWVPTTTAATATAPAQTIWQLKYANGSYATQTWEKVNSAWYYFGADTNMMTGLVTVGTAVYYLNPSGGAMQSGWVQIGTDWYYFTDEAHATTEQPYGSLVRSGKTPDGYTVDLNGRLVGS